MNAGDLSDAPAGVAFGELVGVPMFSQMLGRKLAHGVQQPEAPAEGPRLHHEHRSFDQSAQEDVDIDDVERWVGGGRLGCGEIEWASKDRQSLEHGLFGR